jgi:iron-sulfur cluster repair protein YtfE (RIC family)
MTELNHEFYEQVRQEHEELREWLGRLHHALTERTLGGPQIAEMFGALCEHLERHFKDEEIGGFFEQVVAMAPRFVDRTTELREEHAALRAELQGLAKRAGDAKVDDAWWRELHDGFHAFSRGLMQHENKENELLQDVYDEDVGSKD